MKLALLSLIPFYIGYILFIGRIMFKTRVRALKKKDISAGYLKAYEGEVPQRLIIVKNHYENQFQVPVIFFITIIGAIALQTLDLTTVILGYAFVLSRFAHTFFHLGSNKLQSRALSYTIGLLIIFVMWILIIAKLL